MIICTLIAYLVFLLTKKSPTCNTSKDCDECEECNYKNIYYLTRGSTLNTNGTMFSPNMKFKGVLASNGIFAIYKTSDNSVKWKFPSVNINNPRLSMQTDGNLVGYGHDGVAYWNSGTPHTDSLFAYIDNTGTLYVGSKKIS